MASGPDKTAENRGHEVGSTYERSLFDAEQHSAVVVDQAADLLELGFEVVAWRVSAGEGLTAVCLVEISFEVGVNLVEVVRQESDVILHRIPNNDSRHIFEQRRCSSALSGPFAADDSDYLILKFGHACLTAMDSKGKRLVAEREPRQ